MTNGFYLGGRIDPATGERVEGDRFDYEAGDLTTHGIIVGMTGSGKTGLGIIYLEEALLNGIPTLVIDPKGDMTNLLLTFPDLLPSDFEPWIDEAEARTANTTVAELASAKAALWKKGLGWWDQDGSRIAALQNAAEFTVYTPGSGAGAPINIVGSLANPGLDWDASGEALRDEIQGFVTGLLSLAGITADPISSREHILLANLIEHAWRLGLDLDMATLLAQVQQPPLRKLGVFEVDTFFPEKDRVALAMKLNGLVASPSFASWMEGAPLDIGNLLWTADGKPRAAVVYIAHLSESERQFIVTLLLSKVVTWMRAQSGTGDLRTLVYMDEVFGFVPPTAEPPAKKPILTLLKQARAFGVGLLLSTQNPVDLDYKAMSNAGTWCVGRLQTERDKARILEALKSASGAADVTTLDKAISGLDKRQFVLHQASRSEPTLFTTRWALSYLAGPLTREQISRLPADRPTAAATPDLNRAPVPNAGAEAAAEMVATPGGLADDETPVMPKVAEGVLVFHVDPAAPWLADVGGSPAGQRHQAGIAARVHLTYDDTASQLAHQEEWEAIFTPLGVKLDPDTAMAVDYDDRDFRSEAPANPVYVLPDAPVATKSYFSDAEKAIAGHLYRNARVTVFKNPELRIYSRVGESEADFTERCDVEAQKRADEEAAKLRDRYEQRIDRVKDQLLSAERRVEELEVDLQGQRQQQLIEGAGALVNILMGRRSTRSITGSARSRKTAASKQARLETAQEKAQDKARDLTELEEAFRADLEEINDKWELAGAEVEPVEVGLEKNDIHIDEIALVWIPVE